MIVYAGLSQRQYAFLCLNGAHCFAYVWVCDDALQVQNILRGKFYTSPWLNLSHMLFSCTIINDSFHYDADRVYISNGFCVSNHCECCAKNTQICMLKLEKKISIVFNQNKYTSKINRKYCNPLSFTNLQSHNSISTMIALKWVAHIMSQY